MKDMIKRRKQLFNARSFKKPVKKLKLASTTLPHLFQTNPLFNILLNTNYKYTIIGMFQHQI